MPRSTGCLVCGWHAPLQALAQYQTALQLSPGNQELALKVRSLNKLAKAGGGGAAKQRPA